MSAMGDLYNEVKLRLKNPNFSPIIIGFLLANFDPIFLFIYKMRMNTTHYFDVERHLKSLHFSFGENVFKTFCYILFFLAIRILVPKIYSIVDEFFKSITVNILRKIQKIDLKEENANLNLKFKTLQSAYWGFHTILQPGNSAFVSAIAATDTKWQHGKIDSTVSEGDAVSFDNNRNIFIKAIKRRPDGIYLKKTNNDFGIVVAKGYIKLKALDGNIEKRPARYTINFENGKWEEYIPSDEVEPTLLTADYIKLDVTQEHYIINLDQNVAAYSPFELMGMKNFQ
ncbi:hypothetical protein [Leptospira sarikeiensis]|uniref:Uncharacterized protein n=1 Tax=Leptospira sarikeiensis TaxID=2484943 RepID=A0A4R9K4T3_9LEPT|nr:hypothetical protein [Leptospira sarikeiensis]TGL61162.1 hypothetical protein EHQ64_11125 [Leptospira sarikeiensis]